MSDSIVTIHSAPVMYISGDRSAPIPEQAPSVIGQMESKLPSLRGRRCYGVVVDGEYRPCVTIHPDDDPSNLGLPEWELPGGEYVRRKITDFHSKVNLIPTIIDELMQRNDYDSSRPTIEYYRSHFELLLMVPVVR